MLAAKALTGAPNARKQLLRRDRAIHNVDVLQARITVAARLRQRVTKGGQQNRPPALRRLAQAHKQFEAAALHLFMRLVRIRHVNQPAHLGYVAHRVKHPRIRRQPVPSRAPGLLIVRLNGLWDNGVRHKAHIRLVDAHAKRNRGANDQARLLQEALLMQRARGLVQPSVIGQRLKTMRRQPVRGILRVLARKAIHDAGRLWMALLDEAQQLLHCIALRHNGVADVWPVESGNINLRSFQPQLLNDLLARWLVGSCRACQPWHQRKLLMQLVELNVLRPKVVAPLRNAVRFINRKQRQLRAAQHAQKTLGHKPLRRHVDQIVLAALHCLLRAARIAGRHAGVNVGRAHTCQAQCINLVLHQRNQR